MRQSTQNRFKAFLSFDGMFSTVPVILMLCFVLSISAILAHDAAEKIHRQRVFDRLVSIADYTVKAGAARTTPEGLRYPNWVDESRLTDAYADDLKTRAGLAELQISFSKPGTPFDACIYRIVVAGEDRHIARIFVCGG